MKGREISVQLLPPFVVSSRLSFLGSVSTSLARVGPEFNILKDGVLVEVDSYRQLLALWLPIREKTESSREYWTLLVLSQRSCQNGKSKQVCTRG